MITANDANDIEPLPVELSTKLLTRSALRNMPKPEPLIDNVLDQGTVALLYGNWGTCKSFIALDWAASVATGREWQGRSTERRKVLYVAAEGAFGPSVRVDAWESGWGREISDEDLAILPEPVNLTVPADVGNLIDLIEWGGYGFVVLDTLARCMVGGDENSARDCGAGGRRVDPATQSHTGRTRLRDGRTSHRQGRQNVSRIVSIRGRGRHGLLDNGRRRDRHAGP